MINKIDLLRTYRIILVYLQSQNMTFLLITVAGKRKICRRIKIL